MKDQRRNHVVGERAPFAELARDAIRRAVPEARADAAHWRLGVNSAWVRFPEADRWTFIGLHRHLDWLSGEAGVATEPCELDDLFALPGTPERAAPGYRVKLGDLLNIEDRWWRAGGDEHTLVERLEWMAMQLRVKAQSYFMHHPLPTG